MQIDLTQRTTTKSNIGSSDHFKQPYKRAVPQHGLYHGTVVCFTTIIFLILFMPVAACNKRHAARGPANDTSHKSTVETWDESESKKTPSTTNDAPSNITTTEAKTIESMSSTPTNIDSDTPPTVTSVSPNSWYSMPNLDSWRGLRVVQPPDQTTNGTKYALAYHFDGKIFKKMAKGGEWLTYIRRSNWVKVTDIDQGPGCEKGTWYKATDGGFVCTSRGFKVSDVKKNWPGTWLLPDTNRILPFAYAEVTRQEALSLYRLPKSNELEDLKAGKKDIEIVSRQLTGDNLLALHRKVSRLEHNFYETVRGRFVLAKDLKSMPGSRTHGIFYPSGSNTSRQSIAFIFKKGTHAYQRADKTKSNTALEDLGSIPRYARFFIKDQPVLISGTTYVEDNSGHLVKRQDVRLSKLIEPPNLVGKNKWIHVNRKEQTLTAYLGRTPIFATMISSGKPGFDTPSGLQRIYEKHISRTMRGSDPKEGSYVVEEVPWTMYYQDSYALHGAYWHDDFGNTKSHGCTNIPPADARWLFYWTSPSLKTHWHASRDGLGTFVYIQ